jgi:methylthioribulose-1-phosphate dehydratase
MDIEGNQISAPPQEKGTLFDSNMLSSQIEGYKESQCTPLFYNAYSMRNAGAVIHTHSQNAVMVTLMYKDEFRITHQEMIKGIKIGTLA